MNHASKNLDLNILEIVLNENKSKEFKTKLEKYKQVLQWIQEYEGNGDSIEKFKNQKEEIENFFYENGLQEKIDEINQEKLKASDKKILNKLQVFEAKTEGELLEEVRLFLHKVIEYNYKKVDPSYGSIRTTVDGFKIQVSYRLVNY